MLNKLFSMRVAVILMLIFAISIGTATFIENDYGTQTARALVYNAKWFEVLLFYFSATVLYNIIRFKMYRRQKWGQFTLHIALLLVAIGAFTTRYFGYEGIMHLRNNQVSNKMISDVMMLGVGLKEFNKSKFYYTPLYLSSMGKNSFSKSYSLNDKSVDIKLLRYIPATTERVVKDAKNGKMILRLKLSNGGKGEESYLAKGSSIDLGSILLSFDKKVDTKRPTIFIHEQDGNLTIKTPFKLMVLDMASRESKEYPPGIYPLKSRKLYQSGNLSLVLRSVYPKAKLELASASIKPDNSHPRTIILKVTHNNESKTVRLDGFKQSPGESKIVNFKDIGVKLSYGPKTIYLPFAIKLDRFELKRYPGSMSPASYSSYVTIIDKEKNITMPYHIYMNHVLDYRGFRFFQSSYDMDEQGSILSVNHDPGTLISYLGYLLLAIGFLWSYITPKGRFQELRRKLKKLRATNIALILFALILTQSPLKASSNFGEGITKEQKALLMKYDLNHALKFGELVVQDSGGRMKPVDTLANQILSKISRKSSLFGLNADQILLAMVTQPDIFQKMKIIKINHPAIIKKLGLPKGAKYASYDDFFDIKNGGSYKLAKDVQIANRKRSAERNQYDKEIIKVDERLNILYMTFQGSLLRIFPKPKDPNNAWLDPVSAIKSFPPKEAQLVQLLTSGYFKGVLSALKTQDWSEANRALSLIKKYQEVVGKAVIPSNSRIKFEIEYNKLNIFNRLVPIYILVGLVLLILAFVNIVKPQFSLKWSVRISLAILILAFIAQTFGMGLRWYIAGHAPWSNAYESIIYISWATVLAGFVFAKESPITLASTSILAGIFLFVAHLNWLDPQITNLVPVLQSYWLMIHVAVITASYGFLALGALLGLFVLILFIIKGKKENANINRAIKELTYINEMTLLIGLGLVTVGNFLGGVWANESWGRYWSWDPKETWAAVTILVYASVVHMRFIPKLYSFYSFNVSALLAYSSVIMTYFGVNYYLSGMHSYAAGDPVPIPVWVWPSIAFVFVIIILAYRNRELK